MYPFTHATYPFVVALVALAPMNECTPKPQDAKSKAVAEDLKRLAGTWELVFSGWKGKEFPLPPVWTGTDKPQITILPDGSLQTEGAEESRSKSWYRIDPTARPKTIDFVRRLKDGREQVLKIGIYEIDGDELHKCDTPSRRPRPTDFTFNRDSYQVYHLYRRVKEKK